MFIQCQHCQATYKIDEQKIPDQDTFVRCSKCNTPISLNKQEQSALSRQQPHKIVDCSSCGTRYSIPLDKLAEDTVTVRCGKCGHVFKVSADDDSGAGTYDDSNLAEADDLDLDSISIPEENEIEVDGLFDDVEMEEATTFDVPEELDDFADPELEDDDFDDMSKGPTEAYLDSIDLSGQTDDEIDGNPDLGEISPDEKSQLFLKPNPRDSSDQIAAKQLGPDDDGWPDIHDETGPPDSELDEFVELDDLDDIPVSDDYDGDDPLELQEMSVKRGPSRWLVVVLLVLLFALIGAAGWFYFQTTPPDTMSSAVVENFNKNSRLKLLEPLKGRFVTNANSGEKIFMLEGTIRNNYATETAIEWIEVKGALYDRSQNLLSETTVFAGDIVEKETLQEASIEELNALRDGKRTASELELDNSQTVAFQILFFNVGNNIQKLQAQISRFSRKQAP